MAVPTAQNWKAVARRPGPDLWGFNGACNPETTGERRIMNRNMEAVTWAMKVRGIEPGPWRLLVMLAGRVGKKNYDVWPSYRRMADDAETSLSSAKRFVKQLTDLGYLTLVAQRKRPDGGRSSNVYRLNVKMIARPMDDYDEEDPDDPLGQIEPGVFDSYDHAPVLTGEQCNEPLSEGTSDREDSLPSEGGTRHGEQLVLTGQEIEARAPSLHEAVLTGWKAMRQQVPAIADIRGMDDSRKRAITARGRDAVACGAASPEAGWSEIFAAVARSTFLRGEAAPGKGRQTSFRLTLDFVLKPNNFRKILEGGYDDRHDARTTDIETGRHYGPAEQAGREGLPGFLARLEERRGGRAAG